MKIPAFILACLSCISMQGELILNSQAPTDGNQEIKFIEHVKKQDAIKHANSPNCAVYEYQMKNSQMSIAVAEIVDRYPEQGYAINHQCSEMGYVLKGGGRLVSDTQEVILSVGDVVYIPHSVKFYWEGNLTVILASTPSWDPAQYELTSSPS